MRYTVEQVEKWPRIGQTQNEDYGVDSVHAKKLKNGWVYANLWWRYQVPTLSWVLENGKLLQDD